MRRMPIRTVFTALIITAFLAAGTAAQTAAGSSPRDPKHPVVVMETSLGAIEITLDTERAPATVENFLSYVDEKFYDGTIFHRVIPNFMIQGGGFNIGLTQKQTKAPVRNEAANGLLNRRCTIAMARTQVIDSATCQFFINVVDNPFLDHKDDTPKGFGYAVFGQITNGVDVVDKIAAVKTQNSGGAFQNIPVEQVVILSVRRK